ncbi:hypothetical protein NEOLEDRAFT_1180073 [Neolentinus lepideus HHB14362 ss-1]|uniref:Uncharacterized protein n=1 Tax=Neolentinus lepideus HHB14362 ss-1 TaxID=1314782 RepID=A0A165R7M4_9AGAM|nr:hypothetical protein NEOLEDRAFT_1180073 [Neolentinus lepideus HHB14362 ss-1]
MFLDDIVGLQRQIAGILGYKTWATYGLEITLTNGANKVLETDITLDETLLQKYLPVSVVVPAILDIYRRLSGVRYEKGHDVPQHTVREDTQPTSTDFWDIATSTSFTAARVSAFLSSPPLNRSPLQNPNSQVLHFGTSYPATAAQTLRASAPSQRSLGQAGAPQT